MEKSRPTLTEIKLKIARYCAYQERSHKEVEQKLRNMGLYGDEASQLMVELIKEGYLNESRFAEAYAGGKSRVKKWGMQKIKMSLKQKGVSDAMIEKALGKIDRKRYLEEMKQAYEKKIHSLKTGTPFEKKMKAKMFLMRKGFSPDDLSHIEE